MVSNQQFRLKWNNHRNTVLQEFETLLHNNSFVDCTIGADGKYLKAHKIVLSACSPYLQNVFSEHFDKHPVILLKDVSFKELKCMIDYMYCGEVNISECELPSFLRTAQSLKIKGLAEDINEYDDSGASDNEHQEISSLTENGRTVEPSVEIHDDEGPPTKRSAPSLIYSNFAGRKRKSPNAINSGAPKSSNNSGGDKIIAAATSKTGGNVPVSSCADTENSDSNVCTTSKDNNVNKDVNDKRSNSQDDLQEHKNKAVVKEEPLDADDDNSSYEFVNNPCDDSDPLNEDSESNCANSGKNFNEVSIANVSSCNEAEANDGDDNDDDDDDGKSTNVKEELLISELVTMQEEEDGTDEGKIRVRSCEELMSSLGDDGVPLNSETDIYVVTGPNDGEEISDSDAQNRSSCRNEYERVKEMVSVCCAAATGLPAEESAVAPEKVAEKRCSSVADEKNPSKMASRFFGSRQVCKRIRAKKRKAAVSAESKEVQKPQPKSGFRKILPAPMKPATLLPATLLPVPLAAAAPSATALMSSAQFSSQQKNRTTSSKMTPIVDPKSSSGEHPSASGYRMIAVSAASSTSSTAQQSSQQEAKRSSSGGTADKEEGSQPILFSRVVLLNSSDVQSSSTQPIYTLPPVSSAKGSEIREVAFIRAPTSSPAALAEVEMKNIADVKMTTPKKPAVLSFTQKFRRIAPLPDSEGGICRLCSGVFTSRSELTKHMPICSKTMFGKKGRKKNDA